MVVIKFEADSRDHQKIEQWVMNGKFKGEVGLFTQMLSSNMDFRRDARLTRGAQRASRKPVRVFEASNKGDACLFKLAFCGIGTFRII